MWPSSTLIALCRVWAPNAIALHASLWPTFNLARLVSNGIQSTWERRWLFGVCVMRTVYERGRVSSKWLWLWLWFWLEQDGVSIELNRV